MSTSRANESGHMTTSLPRKILYKYIRFSSIQQAKGSSYARQNERIDKYAAEHGYVVDETLKLEDLAKSGFHGLNNEDDQGLGRFRIAIKRGLIPTDGSAYLAVEQFDRLSRQDINKAQKTLNSILEHNVNVITLMDGKIYTKESMTDFMQVMYSMFLMEQAHQESLKKSDRIKGSYANKIKKLQERVKEQKAMMDEWEKNKSGDMPTFEPLINEIQFSSQVPEWIDQKIEVISGRRFVKFTVNPEKAEIIRYALSLLNDDNGYMNVANRLNQEGIPRIDFVVRRKRSTRKNIWTNSAVNNFVNSDAIFGELSIHDNSFVEKEFELEDGTVSRKVKVRTPIASIPNYYPAVMDKKLVLGLRARANSKKKGRVAGRTTNDNLFQNMLFCGKCGDSMHMRQTKRETKKGTYVRRYLACYAASHKGCDAKMISYTEVERELVKRLVMPIDESKLDGAAKKVSDKRNEKILELEGEVKDLEDRIAECNRTMASDKNVPMTVVISIISQLNVDKDFKTHQLQELILQKEKLLEALESGPVSQYDISTESGRVSFKTAVKQKYAGFVIFSDDHIIMTMHKHGGAGFWKMNIKSRWGTTIEPKRTTNTIDLFGGMLERIKGISADYKEGKLYELVKSYKANDITLFEEEYTNKGLPQPLSYQRGE